MRKTASRAIAMCASGVLVALGIASCGAIESATDCVGVADSMSQVASDVTGDAKTLHKSTDQLRDEAKGIEDADLKKAANEIADEAESINAGVNGDVAEGAKTDTDGLKKSIDDFQQQCNALS